MAVCQPAGIFTLDGTSTDTSVIPGKHFSSRETLFPTAGTIAPHRRVGTKTVTLSPRAGLLRPARLDQPLPPGQTYHPAFEAWCAAVRHCHSYNSGKPLNTPSANRLFHATSFDDWAELHAVATNDPTSVETSHPLTPVPDHSAPAVAIRDRNTAISEASLLHPSNRQHPRPNPRPMRSSSRWPRASRMLSLLKITSTPRNLRLYLSSTASSFPTPPTVLPLHTLS
ncbi:hypothetical protein IV203_014497 [Nitzschia inconspicua]|uniref:Uncharacterized protein n=1 Tax=Nitzschia inconspicua TaxID=303405 RepID=A0A9K3PS76_9STRA|nr:hypothetical protein IV203_014497 [Nitzschia inconspicua]